MTFRKDWHDSSHLAGIDGEDQVLGGEDQTGAAKFDEKIFERREDEVSKVFVGSINTVGI